MGKVVDGHDDSDDRTDLTDEEKGDGKPFHGGPRLYAPGRAHL
jgi:hypothetical protein